LKLILGTLLSLASVRAMAATFDTDAVGKRPLAMGMEKAFRT
jgi:hypothetical protein